MHKIQKKDCKQAATKQAQSFLFLKRTLGIIRFQVRSLNGNLPEEESASLLAMHCLVRNVNVEEFRIVELCEEQYSTMRNKALQLLETGRKSAGSTVRLSSRQKE